MRRLSLVWVIVLGFTVMATADPLYKWVDAQGNVHYSDKPHPGAQKLQLPKASTFVAPNVVPPSPAVSNPSPQDNALQGYTKISVSSPKDQEVLWNTTTVTVTVALEPALQAGDTVTISVDGKSQTVDGTSATFTDIWRGEHDVTVSVNPQHGAALTAQSVFYIQRGTQKKS